HNYYSLLLLNKTLEQRKESLKITKSLEKEYKRRVNLGLARSFELAGFSSRVAIIEAEIYSLEQQIIAGEERIRFLSGINSVQTIKDDISIGTPGYDEKEAMDSLNNRVDIKAAKASLNYSKEKELGAKGEFLPNVYVDGIYNIPQGNTSESYFFQFILEVPIFSGGKTISSIQEYESLRREAELNLNITLKNGLEEIRNLYRTFEISIKERESYKKALEAADKSHKLTLRDYNRKLAASPDILNSLSNLALVKENYERSEIQVRLNRILLGIAVGEFPKNANHWKEKN
ncbi:MAG: TolC family protein, partial [Leptospiraceae bacterium]|nr:TolC family protein [Leptospiraceae bacterium]